MTTVISARQLGKLLEEAAVASVPMAPGGYQFRSPARVSPEQAERLRQRDERHAEHDGTRGGSAQAHRDAAAQRRAKFDACLEQGLTVAEAGALVEISLRTAREYDRLRRNALESASP